MTANRRLPAEWEEQSFVMLAFPDEQSDWSYMLEEVRQCYFNVIHTILKYEDVLLVCRNIEATKQYMLPDTDNWQEDVFIKNTSTQRFVNSNNVSLTFVEVDTNDTWARDFGGITIVERGKRRVLDFGFNGWGLKFAANLDNRVTSQLFSVAPQLFDGYHYTDCRQMILEGGSIESDGKGTVLTTEKCLLSDNRNYLSKSDIECRLAQYLGAERVLWLTNGVLQGDDTDSHIDTLARLCDTETIAYVQCLDPTEPHYNELRAMEEDLRAFRTADGKPYRLVPLPMADEVIFEGERIPATYANFLIINGAVVVPLYQSPKDGEAVAQLQKIFPDRIIEGVDCRALIKQHGSLHCITMQFPKLGD